MDNNIILVFALIIAILMLISFLSSKPSVAETFLSSCTGNIYNPGCLRDLNDWARDLAPKTSLNRYCENKDALNQDLVPGQYCVANCKFGKPFWKGSKWIPGGKKKVSKNKVEKAIKRLYPHAKPDEVEMLVAVNTKKEIVKYLEDLGYDDKQIKELL